MTSDGATGENIGSDFSYTVTVSGGNFLLTQKTQPSLTIYKGFTYVFDVSDSSNSGHPLNSQRHQTELMVVVQNATG